jgi:hypothetical protein
MPDMWVPKFQNYRNPMRFCAVHRDLFFYTVIISSGLIRTEAAFYSRLFTTLYNDCMGGGEGSKKYNCVTLERDDRLIRGRETYRSEN